MQINSLFDVFEHVLNVSDGLHAAHTDIQGNISLRCVSMSKNIKMHLYI